VTIVESDADPGTIEDVNSLGKFVCRHYIQQGSRPKLADLLLHEPVAFANTQYIRGGIGAMNSYMVDSGDVFQVREGMVGFLEKNQAFVFRYTDEKENDRIFDSVTKQFAASHRYSDTVIKDGLCTMVDRDRNVLVVRNAATDIVAVIGQNRVKVESLAEQLVKKLGDN